MDKNTAMRYALFRNAGVRNVLRSLNEFSLGRIVTGAVKEYHGKASDIERIPLDSDVVWPILAHELAWRYFNEHDANPENLRSKLERMMRKYHMTSIKVSSAYAGRVYTDARVRLVLRELRSRGVA